MTSMSQAQAKYLKDYQFPLFTIEKTHLTFQLDETKTKVIAVNQIKRLGKHKQGLVLDGENLQLISVKLNGEIYPYQHIQSQTQNGICIETDLDELTLEIVTEIDPVGNSSLEGLYMSDGAYCTQCEAEGFRHITYFLDRPDVLAQYQVRIEADKKYPFLLSNGNLIEKGELDNNRHYACWQDPFPKPSYLFALVAGDFDQLTDSFTTQSGRKIDLQVFVDKGNLQKANHAMVSLKKAMKWDEQRFGLEYDLDIYMIVAVDFFNMGAMENKGLNIFNTKYVLADESSATDDDYHGIESVIGHEYFHNWTGNRITCRDWFQLSLKEGLTVFRDQEFSADLGSRAVNRIHAIKVVKNQQFAEDSGPMAHPIRPESVIQMNNFYTVTVYNKGAEVIRMMHTLLGEDKFQQGMKLYFSRHDGQAVTCDDFVSAMEDASHIDLTQFRRWYNQAGTPIVTVTDNYDANKKQYSLTISQHNPLIANNTQPLHIPFDLELLNVNGKSLVSKVLDVKDTTQVFEFDNMDSCPIPSLLQNFSAPVKLEYAYTIEQLVHLMRFATSDVARWEASVTLISQAIWNNVDNLKQHKSMHLDPRIIDAFRGALLNDKLDGALVAEIFTIPSIQALIEQVKEVDLDKLLSARAFIIEEMGSSLEDELLVCYRAMAFNGTNAADRALKNTCLYWLASISETYEKTVIEQYQSSTNMTDSLGALIATNNANLVCRDELMADFEKKWLNVPLVMDKWFTLQATQNTDKIIENLHALSQHQAFNINNPNRVRSLIGAFAAGNLAQFHRLDGKGYDYLTEQLIELNRVNPQVAARLITSLIQFAKFDVTRQLMIKNCLLKLKVLPDLSKDLYEKITKALGE